MRGNTSKNRTHDCPLCNRRPAYIPQNIELVPAAEPDLFQQTTEQIVIAVNIGNAIIHISIIPFAAGKSNTLPKSGARNMRRRSMPPMLCGVRRSLQTQAYPARRARTPSAFCPPAHRAAKRRAEVLLPNPHIFRDPSPCRTADTAPLFLFIDDCFVGCTHINLSFLVFGYSIQYGMYYIWCIKIVFKLAPSEKFWALPAV